MSCPDGRPRYNTYHDGLIGAVDVRGDHSAIAIDDVVGRRSHRDDIAAFVAFPEAPNALKKRMLGDSLGVDISDELRIASVSVDGIARGALALRRHFAQLGAVVDARNGKVQADDVGQWGAQVFVSVDALSAEESLENFVLESCGLWPKKLPSDPRELPSGLLQDPFNPLATPILANGRSHRFHWDLPSVQLGAPYDKRGGGIRSGELPYGPFGAHILFHWALPFKPPTGSPIRPNGTSHRVHWERRLYPMGSHSNH